MSTITKPAAMPILAAILTVAAAQAAPPPNDNSSIDQRLAPNPNLTANLIFRIILATTSTLLCWVPFRLLSRNGDFAPVALILVLAAINLFTVINGFLWSGDAWDTWWDGAGLCDVEAYLLTPLYTAYAASIFALIYRLAQQVKLARATRPSRRERRRIAKIQAAIILPVPVFQVLFTYFDISQRYKIGTVVGCLPVYDVSWPRVVVYEIPNPIFVFASVPFAVLAWKRYRTIVKGSKDVLTSNSTASMRARQARCRLYNMSLSILVVYLPVSIYFMIQSLKGALDANFKPYNYWRIHYGNNPYPWDAILFVPSWLLPSAVLNQPWVSISTNIVIIAFFGTTRDGVDMYRRYAVAIGLGRCFSRLKKQGSRPTNSPDDGDNTLQSWIELDDLGDRKDQGGGRKVVTGRARRASPYPLLDTGTDTSFGPEPLLQTPGRPLPQTPTEQPPPQQTPPRKPITFQLHSPLESSRVIASLVPERRSSLNRQQQEQYQSALHAPASELPRIAELPDLNGTTGLTNGRDIIGPWVGRSTRPRANTDDSAVSPMLPPPNKLEWLSSRPGGTPTDRYYNSSSPRTIDTMNHKTSRDAVQPRNMIGGWDGGLGHVSAPSPLVPAASSSSPMGASTLTATEVRWPFLEDLSQDGEEKKKGDGEEDEDDEDSFIRHRDDPLDDDPWNSPPTQLAPGLEVLHPRPGGRRVRIPRTQNVQFDQYMNPKKDKSRDSGTDKDRGN